MKVLSRKK